MTRKRNRKPTETRAPITITAELETIDEPMAKRGRGSVSKRQAASVRALIEFLLKSRFNQNMSDLGRSIGVTGQAVSLVRNEFNQPGWPIVSGLATYLRVGESDVLAWSPESILEGTIRGEQALTEGAFLPTEGNVEHMAELLRLRDLPRATYPRLEFALGYYAHEQDRWSPATLNAARAGQFERLGCRNWTPPQWTDALDRLETLLREQNLTAPPSPHPAPPQLPPPSPVRGHKRQ
jgi:hypothetical protein